jgi:phosphohistidine swiveling domain-containing protein
MFFILALLILFSGFTVMRTFASGSHVDAETAAEAIVYADTGDTLWELAASLKKDSMDIRQAVHLIMERNNLTSPAIQSGQKIIVPGSVLP